MTRDEMVSYVLDRTMVSGSDTARVNLIVAMLKQAHQRVVSENFLIQRYATLTLNGGSPVVSLPNDWSMIRSLKLGSRVLSELTASQMDRATGTAATGDPVAYQMRGPGEIWVYPTPSETRSDLEMHYDGYPTEMSLGSSEPDGLPLGYHEIIPELVIARVLLAEEEPALAAAAKAEAGEMLARMQMTLSRRFGRGRSRVLVGMPISSRYGGSRLSGPTPSAVDDDLYPSAGLFPS